MNDHKEAKEQEVFTEALVWYTAGRTIPEILHAFPHHAEELRELLGTIAILRAEKNTIYPPQELARRILTHLDGDAPRVIKREEDRFILQEGKMPKGRPSLLPSFIINNQYAMNSVWKIIIPMGLIALLILVVGVIQFGSKTSEIKLAMSIEKESQEVQESMDRADDPANEPTLDELNSGVGEAGESALTPTSPVKMSVKQEVKSTSKAVNVSSILSEQKTVDFGSEVNDFISGELGTQELNAALGEF